MNITFKLLMPVAAVSLPLCIVASDGSASAKERAAIVELLRKHDAALAAGNVDALYALGTDDYLEMPAGSPPADKATARKALADFLNQYHFTATCEIRDLEVHGKTGYLRADCHQRMTAKSGQEPLKGEGKSLMILKREGSTWKIKTNMWNNNGEFVPAK